MFFSILQQKIPIKPFVVVYLILLLTFSAISLGEPIRLWKGLLIVLLYAFFDLLWTYLRDRRWFIPLSSVISGLILALVAVPDPNLVLPVFLPLIAVVSKQLFHFGKAHHIFNPAAFALVFTSFFTLSISWWGVAWGMAPLVIASVAGIFILLKLHRFYIVGAFLLTYMPLLALQLFLGGASPGNLVPLFKEGTLVFFMSVMLIEPITSAFPKRKARIMYGALVGIFAFLTSFFTRFLPNGDPLLYGLVLGNAVATFLFLPNILAKNPQI